MSLSGVVKALGHTILGGGEPLGGARFQVIGSKCGPGTGSNCPGGGSG